MSKAILVVDVNMTQDNKHICEDDEQHCPLWNKDIKFCMYNFNNNTKGCPLKPIVFCEECKYADKLGEWSKYDFSCRYFNTHSVDKGSFCSYGESKNESNIRG